MSNKTIAIRTIVVLASFIMFLALFTASYAALQQINPVAAFAAVAVAVIGIAWFKKTST